ncbi:GntR family transcriptional regulator [Scopulibacillus cellulosilyticus]|uniref:GntR family transcriptional regulator n=1 Tax=Scopulibacillus cellulosilyticus TaxID=2665665 RepID=A0ABW2PY32_9BACL
MKNVTLDIVLAEKIKAYIATHQLKENERIPSNRDLAKIFNVQRMTVTMALNRLVNEGIIFSVPRKGYFVSEKKIIRDLVKFESFSEMMKSKGLKVVTKLMSIEIQKGDKIASAALGISEETNIYKIRRLRIISDHPFTLETSYIPEKYVKGIENHDLEGQSLYKLLERIYGIVLCGATQEISMVTPVKEDRLLLDVSEGEELLLLRSVANDKNGKKIEYSESLTRGDRCLFRNVLTRKEV